jgi:hypothetical protein
VYFVEKLCILRASQAGRIRAHIAIGIFVVVSSANFMIKVLTMNARR